MSWIRHEQPTLAGVTGSLVAFDLVPGGHGVPEAIVIAVTVGLLL